MRIRIPLLLSTCLTLVAPSAWAQAPGPLPPAPPPGMVGPGAPPGPAVALPWQQSAPPVPQAYPPPAWSPPGPPQPPVFTPAPPMSPPAAPPPAEAPPLQLAGRVGFGLGFYVAPGARSYGASPGALGALGGLASYGGSLGLRWWVRERIALFPSLNLSISHSTIPNQTDEFQRYTQGGSYTSGTVAPGLSLGYAAYRGKSTRFLVMGGVGFNYSASQQIKNIQSSGANGGTSRYVTAKSLSFDVPFGFALEQFLTSRISVTLGAQAPLFEFRSTKVDVADATTSVGANFDATQLDASIYFYTD